MLSHRNLRLISRLDPPSLSLKAADGWPQNHTVLHSFLSNVVEEFLVRNSFAKPPPQVQHRDESTQNPRKRRRLADHIVSVYSPGPSQQSYPTPEFGYPLPEQEYPQSGRSDCSGSCDGCSSCCDECLYSHEGNNSAPGLPSVYHDDEQQGSGEYSLNDEVFYARVSSNPNLSTACS